MALKASDTGKSCDDKIKKNKKFENLPIMYFKSSMQENASALSCFSDLIEA